MKVWKYKIKPATLAKLLLLGSLVSTLSLHFAKPAPEQMIFASEGALTETQKVTELRDTVLHQDHSQSVKQVDITIQGKKLRIILRKNSSGRISAIVPWNQTEGHFCVDCELQKSFELSSRFTLDFASQNETELVKELLELSEVDKRTKAEVKGEVKGKDTSVQDVDASIKEKLLPPGKNELTAGGRLLAAAIEKCGSDLKSYKCLHKEFLAILGGEKKPTVPEALKFYESYMEEGLIEDLTHDRKSTSLLSQMLGASFFNKSSNEKAYEVIQNLLARIPSGFLPLREAIVYTQEKATYQATDSYMNRWARARSLPELDTANQYYFNTVQNLRNKGLFNIRYGLDLAIGNNFIGQGLANQMVQHYFDFGSGIDESLKRFWARPQTMNGQGFQGADLGPIDISKYLNPLPSVDWNKKYNLPVNYQEVQFLPQQGQQQQPRLAPMAPQVGAPQPSAAGAGRGFGRL